MGVQLDLSSKLFQPSDESVAHFASSTNGHRVACALLKESLQNVKHVGCHGSLGWESAENAHGVDKVAKEGNGNNLIHSLVQGIEGQWKVEKDIRMGSNEWKTASGSGKETGVLSKVQQRDSGGGSTKSLETLSQCVPFLAARMGVSMVASVRCEVFSEQE